MGPNLISYVITNITQTEDTIQHNQQSGMKIIFNLSCVLAFNLRPLDTEYLVLIGGVVGCKARRSLFTDHNILTGGQGLEKLG